jgi:DNA replication and repair protein RecF
MLLDDVMSELDAARRERLIELVRGGGQAVVAATEPEHVPGARDEDIELLLVADGAVAVEAAL